MIPGWPQESILKIDYPAGKCFSRITKNEWKDTLARRY